jgi:hypothetical protein
MTHTQLQWLKHDLDMVHQRVAADQALLATSVSATDEYQANYPLVAADLLYRAMDIAGGLGSSLAIGLRVASLTLSRSLLETATNLRYLTQHPDPVHAASVLRAYSILRWLELDEDNQAARSEWTSILERMKEDAVEEARQRIAGPHGWTGRPTRQLLEAVGFRPYTVYGFLARESHGGVVGNHATIEQVGEGARVVRLGTALSPIEVESTANRARSFLLAAFMAFHQAIGGLPTSLATEDPETWRAANESNPAA